MTIKCALSLLSDNVCTHAENIIASKTLFYLMTSGTVDQGVWIAANIPSDWLIDWLNLFGTQTYIAHTL